MSEPHVIFATPSLDHRVTIDYLNGMLDVRWHLQQRGVEHAFLFLGGDCFIAKARNKLATDFLHRYPTATDLFFVDDDVGFPADKVIEFIDRPELVLAGVYPKKSEETDFPVILAADKATGGLIEQNGLVAALGAPTGFMRIKRIVLERLAAACGTYKFPDKDGTCPEYHNIFETGVGEDGLFVGEDIAFCRRCTALGIDVWVDPSIPFTHRGQRSWRATMADHMDVFRSRAAEAMERAKEAA